MNKFSKIAGYSIYINLLHFFIQTVNTQKQRVETKILFKIDSKINKILRSKFNQKVKDPYAENYETLVKEFEDDSKKWKDSPCSQAVRINIVKIVLLPKAIFRFNQKYLSKIPMTSFLENQNKYPKMYMELQKTENHKNNPEEKEQSWKHNPARLQTILQSCSIQNCMVLAQKYMYRSME